MEQASFKYAELFSVSVRQPYYANGICKRYQVEPVVDVELLPTAECQALMKRLDFVFRSDDRQAGFIVFARVKGNTAGDDLLRFPPQAGEALTFWMKLRNPDLLNFDDLSTENNVESIYYFTNQQSDALALRSDLHLSGASSGVSATVDSVSASLSVYRFHHSAEVAKETAKVRHIPSGMEVSADSIVNQSGESDLLFLLSSLPPGKCQLIIAGIVKDEFYYLANPSFRPFGVIELSLAASLDANYRIVESDRSLASSRPAYSILFRNRKTFWRYTIHLQQNSALSVEMAALSPSDKTDFLGKLNIMTNDSSITFTLASVGDSELVFVSDTALSLQEKYFSSTSMTHDPLALSLKKYIGVMAKEAIVRSDLPYVQTSLIDATSLPAIYSDIFLTL